VNKLFQDLAILVEEAVVLSRKIE